MKQSHKTLLLWMVLIAMFIAVWQLFAQPSPNAPPDAATPISWATYAVVGPIVALAVWLVVFVRISRRASREVAAFNEAFRKSEFEAAHRHALATPRWPAIYSLLRGHALASVAYASGRFDDALATLSSRAPSPWIFRSQAPDFLALRLARRAVVEMILDRPDAGRASLEAARARATTRAVAAAAALAEIVGGARGRDWAAVRGGIEGLGIAPSLHARDAQLVEAIEAMVSDAEGGAYRRPDHGGVRAPPSAELAAWADRIVPGVARFIGARPIQTELEGDDTQVADAARLQVVADREAAKASHRPRNWRAFGFLGLLVADVAGLVSSSGGEVLRYAASAGIPLLLGLGILLWMSRAQRRADIGGDAAELDGRGHPDQADAVSARLLATADDGDVAIALAHHAFFALHRGDDKAAIARCDKAVAHLVRAEKTARDNAKEKPAKTALGTVEFKHVATQHRTVAASRAVILAALGRDAEARVELALVDPLAVQTRVLVQLYRLARAGDAAGLANLGDRIGTDVSLGMFEATLLSAGRAANGDVVAKRRLDRHLRATPAARTFVEKIAPKLVAAIAP